MRRLAPRGLAAPGATRSRTPFCPGLMHWVVLFAFCSEVCSSVASLAPEDVNLPGGLNLQMVRRSLGQNWAPLQSSYRVSGELQHFESPFLYFPAPYTVQEGDTIDDIAENASNLVQQRVTVQDIVDMNPQLVDYEQNDHLPLRLALNVPGYPAIPPPPTSLSVSDTKGLLTFLRAYHVSLDQVQEANPGLDITDIDKVTTIRVPPISHYPVPECPSCCHCVSAGETLSDVAQQIGVSTEDLLEKNPNVLQQGGRLFVGQVLANADTNLASTPEEFTISPFQNPYQVLLSYPDFPLTPSFLTKLSQVNNLTVSILLSVGGRSTTLISPIALAQAEAFTDPSAVSEVADSGIVPRSSYGFDIDLDPNAAVAPLKDYKVRINQAAYSPAPTGRRRALLPGETVGKLDDLPPAPVTTLARQQPRPRTEVEAFDYLDQQQLPDEELPDEAALQAAGLQDAPATNFPDIPTPRVPSTPDAIPAPVKQTQQSNPAAPVPLADTQRLPVADTTAPVTTPSGRTFEDLQQKLVASGFTAEVAAAVAMALSKKETSLSTKEMSSGEPNLKSGIETGNLGTPQLTPESVKQFAHSVFSAIDSAPAPASQEAIALALETGEEEEEVEEEEDSGAHASTIGDLSSIISAAATASDLNQGELGEEAAALTPTSVKAFAMQVLEHERLEGDGEGSGAGQGAAGDGKAGSPQDLVVKLLSIIRDETHDARLDHILEELNSQDGKNGNSQQGFASSVLQHAQRIAVFDT